MPTLRDARKSQTRKALREAALHLFAAQGYDATSTEEISEKAGVSARTFFRYFPTKEAVLFGGKDHWFESLTEIYCSQPTSLNDVDAMRAALIELAPSLTRRRVTLRLYARSVATSLTLRGLRLDHQEENVRDLAMAIAVRRGLKFPDETCTLLSAIGVMAHRRALETWLEGPDDLELSEVLAEKFGLLAPSVGPVTGPPARRKGARRTPVVRSPNREDLDDAQQLVALEEIRVLNRRVRSASRRRGLAGVARLLRRTRNMKFTNDRPPTK
jgi:AcrR family transcriptional regulator